MCSAAVSSDAAAVSLFAMFQRSRPRATRLVLWSAACRSSV
jgi:hypothetical protein